MTHCLLGSETFEDVEGSGDVHNDTAITVPPGTVASKTAVMLVLYRPLVLVNDYPQRAERTIVDVNINVRL